MNKQKPNKPKRNHPWRHKPFIENDEIKRSYFSYPR